MPDRSAAPLPSRRQFLATSTAAVVAGSLAAAARAAAPGAAPGAPLPATPPTLRAAGSDILKVGLVGCGGRGSGAASQALKADPGTRLVAMGDAFADRLKSSLQQLQGDGAIKDRIAVPPEAQFVGFDAYKRVIDSGIDVVCLTQPPHFRPAALKYAIENGKHVFCEKPIAVDAPGVRSVMQTVELAKQKSLAIVSGLCWRYHPAKRELFARVADGAIGDITAMQVIYNAGELWVHPRKPEWSDMEWQTRNWLYFTWLSGDHIVEQAIHSIDKAGWAMKDEPPVRAFGVGGRQKRTDPIYGHIFDHFGITYEFKNGVRLFHTCRQQNGCQNDVSDFFYGTKGTAEIIQQSKHRITGASAWEYTGPDGDMYQLEHNALFKSIRDGKPINNGHYMCNSTMMAILGRMVAYTGQTLTWEQALNSKEDLTPAKYDWGTLDVPPVAVPGKTRFL